MVRQMCTSVMEKRVSSTFRNHLIHDAVPTAWWHLKALQPTQNTISMVGTPGTIYRPSSFTLSLSSTFALFLCFHIRFHLPFLTPHICLLFSFTLFYSRFLTLSCVLLSGEKSTGSRHEEWNLSTISPLHLCGVKLIQMNFLKQDWQIRYNVALRCVRVMSILPRL